MTDRRLVAVQPLSTKNATIRQRAAFVSSRSCARGPSTAVATKSCGGMCAKDLRTSGEKFAGRTTRRSAEAWQNGLRDRRPRADAGSYRTFLGVYRGVFTVNHNKLQDSVALFHFILHSPPATVDAPAPRPASQTFVRRCPTLLRWFVQVQRSSDPLTAPSSRPPLRRPPDARCRPNLKASNGRPSPTKILSAPK